MGTSKNLNYCANFVKNSDESKFESKYELVCECLAPHTCRPLGEESRELVAKSLPAHILCGTDSHPPQEVSSTHIIVEDIPHPDDKRHTHNSNTSYADITHFHAHRAEHVFDTRTDF
jgi:hypothetical protein